MPANRLAHQVVADRYELLETVGRGGFGVVWRACDTLLQRHVAVKEIHIPGFLSEQDRGQVREKVLREARAAARLDHPGAVTVFDVIDDDGHPVIVMELVEAPNLAELVARRGPLAPAEAARIGLDVLEVLLAAHGRGIVHRDVKPANVMVSDSGRVRLGDFGVAAILDDPTMSTTGSVTGSPAYMAPEQVTNKGALPESDLWSLGATLYFAVEGRPPFDRGAPVPTLTSIVHDEPRPTTRAGNLAPVLDALLVKSPADRLTGAQLRERLAAVAAGEPAAPPPAARADDTAVIPRDDLLAAGGNPPPAPAQAPQPPPAPPAPATPAPDATVPAATVPAATVPAATVPAPAPSPPRATPVRATPPRATPVRPATPVRQAAPVVRQPDRRGGSRGPVVAVVGLVGLVVVALVGVALLAGRSSPGNRSAATGPSTSTGPAGSAAPATTVAASGRTATTVVAASTAGWVPYADPATGFTISKPANWTIRTDGTLTDFRDPATGAYLRVDHVQPPGPSPEGAWQAEETSFSADNANYHRIRIEPTTYGSYRAAIWEFTYTSGGAQLRVANLGFVTPRYGFALYFQSREGDWNGLQLTYQAFKDSFKAPA